MNICVYAASSGKIPQQFVETAELLGRLLAVRKHTLVNGAGRTGLMGAVTKGCLLAGGQAVGVIPQFMVDNGWHHAEMTELVITPDMHSRKEKMAEMADACMALPGGVGTLEELLEIITWKQLGLYLKPIVIINVDGYFDNLLKQLERAVKEQFMRPMHAGLWQVASDAEEAITLAETTPLWDPSLTKFAAI